MCARRYDCLLRKNELEKYRNSKYVLKGRSCKNIKKERKKILRNKWATHTHTYTHFSE